jgi:hypothetical protein
MVRSGCNTVDIYNSSFRIKLSFREQKRIPGNKPGYILFFVSPCSAEASYRSTLLCHYVTCLHSASTKLNLTVHNRDQMIPYVALPIHHSTMLNHHTTVQCYATTIRDTTSPYRGSTTRNNAQPSRDKTRPHYTDTKLCLTVLHCTIAVHCCT